MQTIGISRWRPVHKHLQVSSNELTALLKRVFEAAGCDQSAQEDAAKAIVAAERRGFSALDALPQMIERLQRERPTPAPGSSESNGCLELEANHSSAACYGSVFAGLAAAYAKQGDRSIVARVQSCNDRSLVLNSLLAIAATGIPMLAHWTCEHSPDKRCAYLASPDGAADQYLEMSCCEQNASPECIFLIAAPDFERILPHWQQIQAEYTQNKLVSADDIQRRLGWSLNNGIRVEVPLWEQMQSIALNVLVPSSERSRAGAGA